MACLVAQGEKGDDLRTGLYKLAGVEQVLFPRLRGRSEMRHKDGVARMRINDGSSPPRLMSVPPPSWTPNRRSTDRQAARSCPPRRYRAHDEMVFTAGMEAGTAPKMLVTTDDAIECLWSMQRMISRWTRCTVRP